MDYEKKYKEAIELMKDCIPDADGLVHVRPQDIFHELEESEDGKTKRLLHTIANKMSQHLRDIFTEEEFQCFDAWSNAWLKKQGEQKHTPKPKVGDTIYYNSFGEVKSMIVANITTDSTNNPMYEDENGNAVFEEDLIEQKSAWTPMDEQHVENLLAIIEGHGYPGEVAWLNSLKSKQGKQKPIIEMKSAEESLGIDSETYSKIVDECIYGEQKPAEWSEEDEQLYNDLSDTYFYNDEDYPEETYKRMLKRVLDWMNKRAKSLRPQSTWKPAEMQLKCLKNACDEHWEPDGSDPLYALYQDLKKLREEYSYGSKRNA